MPLDQDIALATAAWQRAQILETSPSWEGFPEHSSWVDCFAELTDPKIDLHLLHLASDERILVSAYAIQTLFRRMSPLLLDLPAELICRDGHLTLQRGSFREKMLYRDFVKSIVKRSKNQRTEQDSTGQPATRPVDDPEGSFKPQPEAEGRSR
jgi:hypothetical protein